jgi:hypothetical protein
MTFNIISISKLNKMRNERNEGAKQRGMKEGRTM